MTNQPRRFHLQRTIDVTGSSGTGRVADGILWPDGTASLRWRGERPSTVHWDNLAHAEAVHGHGGHTRIVWDDPEPNEPFATVCQTTGDLSPEATEAVQALVRVAGERLRQNPPAGDCPHCPDGHTPANGGSQPWHVRVGPERDGDGQPIRLHVERSAGAHVAESDAEYVRTLLRGAYARNQV
ncbi:hypothetical protein SUDANB145_07296 (plasmid) [Streptomyces sp. enrichment culture]|uniref:hypothetical protein n=1 Tax=Streptomyces sp. enrichment culture TaxID=1795815 RepID=UPI003F55AE9C